MKKILIPIDFSEASLNGLKYAFAFAKQVVGELHLFHALNPSPLVADNTMIEDLSALEVKIKDKLEKICEQMAAENKSNTNYMLHVNYGFAEDTILKIVKEKDIDLIIMGTEGSEGRILFGGSLTADLLSRTDCPVLAIPQEYSFTNISKIAFATDLLGNEKAEINYVVEFAQAFDAHIAFLNIQKDEPDNVQDIISTGFNLLNASDYKDMSFHVIEKEDILEGIEYFVEKEDADMVVMSTYKKSLFERMIHKSQTKKLAGSTQIPLLAMHKAKVGVKS